MVMFVLDYFVSSSLYNFGGSFINGQYLGRLFYIQRIQVHPRIIPSTPARLPATNKIMMMVAGWVSNRLPITSGEMRLLSIC